MNILGTVSNKRVLNVIQCGYLLCINLSASTTTTEK